VLRRAGVEGTGSYGAALTRHLRRNEVSAVEVNRPDRAARRHRGKTDTVDAVAAAHAVLSGRASAAAKTGDRPVEMLRMFKLARCCAVKAAPRPSTNSRPSSSAPTRRCANPWPP